MSSCTSVTEDQVTTGSVRISTNEDVLKPNSQLTKSFSNQLKGPVEKGDNRF